MGLWAFRPGLTVDKGLGVGAAGQRDPATASPFQNLSHPSEGAAPTALRHPWTPAPPSKDPDSLPQPKGDSPRVQGEGTPVFCFPPFSFQKKWNNSPGPCSPPSPPLPAFPAAPGRLPAPAPAAAPSLAQLPGGGGVAGEEGAAGGSPAPPQFPRFLLRVWAVVEKGRQGALGSRSPASSLADPRPGPELPSVGLGWGGWGAQAGNNGVIFLDNGGLVRKPGGERRGNSLGPRVTGLTSQRGLGLASPSSSPKEPPPHWETRLRPGRKEK